MPESTLDSTQYHSTACQRIHLFIYPVAPKAVVTNTPFKIRDMLARVPESDKGVQGQPSVSHNHVKTSISTSHVALSIGEWGRRQPSLPSDWDHPDKPHSCQSTTHQSDDGSGISRQTGSHLCLFGYLSVKIKPRKAKLPWRYA